MFLSNKESIVSRYTGIGTLVHFILTLFQLLTMTLLPLSTRNPAIWMVSIGYWLQNFVMKSILQTFLDAKSTVSSNNITSRRFQHNYSPIPVFAFSTRYMQLSISSNSHKKKLLEFTMSMYFHLKVTTCNNLNPSVQLRRLYNVFVPFYTLIQCISAALSQNSIAKESD